MTPSVLLLLWLCNWLVTSAVVVCVTSQQGPRSPKLGLWGLEARLPELVALLLLVWPVALFRLCAAAFLLPVRRGESRQHR